jgi:hypothetical protein
VGTTAPPTPDWLHQVLWFVAGVFATGALWYFAGQKNWLATLWSAFGALAACLLAVTLMVRNDVIRRMVTDRPNARNAEATTGSAQAGERHLSLEQSNYLIAALDQFAGQPVVVGFVLGDTETQVFAQEIAQTLARAGWNIKRLSGMTLTYRGIRLSPQDPTDVPRAAEAVARAFLDQGIVIAKDYIQPSSFEYNGLEYVPTLYLTVGKTGTPTPVPQRYTAPLLVPPVPDVPKDLRQIKDDALAVYAEQLATALREYETKNRRRFEAEWHLHGDPIPKDSYRGVFENVLRPTARTLKDEIHRRLGIGPAIVWAIDADALDGLTPLRDAANYFDELASKLRAR